MARLRGCNMRSIGRLLPCTVAILTVVGCNGDGSNSASSTANEALSLSGSPPSQALIGQAYSFTPTVHAPNDTNIGFSIQNKPDWASFNTTSGQLDGTPTNSDAGSYPNIVISASSAGAHASLPAFTITVGNGGAVTLSWAPPTENTDGTALTDLAGYTIQYGTDASNLTESATVDSPATSYTMPTLASGVWYFTISAYTTDGEQSAPSDVVSTTVD